jgi:serine protease Do
MKLNLQKFIPLFGFAAALPFAQAQDPLPHANGDAHDGAPHMERRVIIKHGPGGPEAMEKAPFLGVETMPVSATLTAQLNLPKGTGLVVQAVVPDSPAAVALKPHDILLKLDDQLLIEPRQFSVLVRNHKEGDEVTLTYVRAGKEATAKVKLALHDVPKFAAMGGEGFEFGSPESGAMPGMDRKEVDHLLSMVHGAPVAAGQHVYIDQAGGPGLHMTNVNAANSKMVYSDDVGVLELTIADGKGSLVAKNAKGDQVFSGPVMTPEERKAMPPDVRVRLEKLEGMQEFSFKTGDDFTPGEMKVMKAPGRRIALPVPPPFPVNERPLFF